MKRFFYSNGSTKEGPLTLDELKQVVNNPKTLIWHEGLNDWLPADRIDELKDLFELTPPPLNAKDEEISIIESTHTPNTVKINSAIGQKSKSGPNPFSFAGRIGNAEYALSLLIFFIVYILIPEDTGPFDAYRQVVPTEKRLLIALPKFFLFWFIFAQGSKRCHDIGNNGWYQLIPFFFVYLIFAKSEVNDNKYGPNTA